MVDKPCSGKSRYPDDDAINDLHSSTGIPSASVNLISPHFINYHFS